MISNFGVKYLIAKENIIIISCGLISNFGVKYLPLVFMPSIHSCGLISNFGVKYLQAQYFHTVLVVTPVFIHQK